MSLLKSINTEIQEGTWDNLKALIGGNKPVVAPEEPDRTAGSQIEGGSELADMASQIMEPRDVRYVMLTNLGGLKLYLSQGGGKRLIDSVKEDKDIVDIITQKDNVHFKLLKIAPDFKFGQLLGGKSNGMSIILDIPKAIADKLENAASSSDAAAGREALNSMMSFKYYVGTLKIDAANGLSADAVGDAEELEKLFNPSVLANYPRKAVWDAAKEEWYETRGEGKEDADVERRVRDAARAEKEKQSTEKLGGEKNEELDVLIRNFLKVSPGQTKTAGQIAKNIKDSPNIAGKRSKQEVYDRLISFGNEYGSQRALDVAALVKDSHWR